MNKYPLLFSQLTINKLTLHNRIIMPAIHLNYTPNGKITDKVIAFYTERAKGGVGLLIIGGCSINEAAGGSSFISIKNDSDIEDLSYLAKTIHNYGTAIGAQLYMAGAYAHPQLIGQQAISSSTHISTYTKNEAREMNIKEISDVQDDFARAAIRAQKAGLDMVEILGSTGYLISQFLSPKINKRTDHYGGSLENRMRFGLETIAKVRTAVGPNFCIGIRISGNDFIEGSHTSQEASIFAQKCVAFGINIINVTGGWHETLVPQITGEVPLGGLSYLARTIRNSINNLIPVAASNRIHTPLIAEKILARGDADLICMCRPLLADPNLPKKIIENREQEIYRCIACNQGCLDAIFSLQPVSCTVNPRVGRETKLTLSPFSPKKSGLIIIVGGGPAGGMAAISAARQGYQVMLLEANSQLGGQINWYYKATKKSAFSSIATWQSAELKSLGVNIRLGIEVNAADLVSLNPTAVIVATGARPKIPSIPGINQSHVIQAWDILQKNTFSLVQGQKIVIIGGGAVGLETALNLARRGALTPNQVYYLTLFQAESPEVIKKLISQGSHQVTVIESMPQVGRDIGRSTRWIILNQLKRFSVKVLTEVQVKSIKKNTVQVLIKGQEKNMPADTVVLATGSTSVNNLSIELQNYGIKVINIGDAMTIGSILKAIKQGYQTGLEV